MNIFTFFGYVPRSELLGHTVRLCLSYQITPRLLDCFSLWLRCLRPQPSEPLLRSNIFSFYVSLVKISGYAPTCHSVSIGVLGESEEMTQIQKQNIIAHEIINAPIVLKSLSFSFVYQCSHTCHCHLQFKSIFPSHVRSYLG